MDTPDVKTMVGDYLKQNGFDGLFSDECACDLSDLMPCGEQSDGCRAGYKGPCNCGEGCDYHIFSKRPDPPTPAESEGD